MAWHRLVARALPALRLLGAPLLLPVLAACTTPSAQPQAATPQVTPQVEPQPADTYPAQITRGADGTPHITASDISGAGWGYGYAQAGDDLCSMADAFLTYRGERSRFFGPDGHQRSGSTLEDVRNIDSDFFFKLVARQAVLARYEAAQSSTLRSLVHGFATGYNRYVSEIEAGAHPGAHLDCRSAPWVTPLTDDDIYRRLFAANIAGGYARFIDAIATAQPPAPDGASTASSAHTTSPASASASTSTPTSMASARLAHDAAAMQHGLITLASSWEVGGGRGIGSNAMAFGADTTADGQSVLLGNPHWFWEGPDRFYQARLTVPGQLDVSGVSFLGIPVIMIGFNHAVAWTHTVSSARRFGFFQLTLTPGDNTRYLYDGRPVQMEAVPLTVEVREADGNVKPAHRVLYRTEHGYLANLGKVSPELAWNNTQAFVIRDINADNFRVFENYLAWDRAGSLDEFEAIQQKLTAMPWVNTIAIGRNDPHVWYADIGAIPNVSDALAARCTTPLGKAFNARAPGVPFLDGSRAACQWDTAPGSPQAGAMPADRLPRLVRTDYVANMNNSYWLANPGAPLTGFPAILGGERQPLGLRSQLGLTMIQERLAGTDGYPGKVVSPAILEQMALDSRALSAARFKPTVLAQACRFARIVVDKDPSDAAPIASQTVDLRSACAVLRAWDGRGDTDARGATLWDTFWTVLTATPDANLYKIPFDPAKPLLTPSGLKVDARTLAKTLGVAVMRLDQSGIALNATRGQTLYAKRGSETIPLFGGCEDPGYFTSACAEHGITRGGFDMNGQAIGNTYLQVVSFDSTGPHAATLLASALSDDPASVHYADGTRRYAKKAWWTVPFQPAADPKPATLLERWHGVMESTIPRDAAEAFGVSEEAILQSELGVATTRLKADRTDILAMLSQLQTLGRLEVMVRSENGITEREVASPAPYFDEAGRLLLADAASTSQLNVAMHIGRWRAGYAVARRYADGGVDRSIQFFDAAGGNIIKINVLADRFHPAPVFDRLVQRYAATDQAVSAGGDHGNTSRSATEPDSPWRTTHVPATDMAHGATPPPDNVDNPDFWITPPDRREASLSASRCTASHRIDAHALVDLLHGVTRDAEWMSVVVGDAGATQRFMGRFTRARDIGDGWYSAQAAGFKVHIRLSMIDHGWIVTEGTGDAATTQVLFVDKQGRLAVAFSGPPDTRDGKASALRTARLRWDRLTRRLARETDVTCRATEARAASRSVVGGGAS